MKRFLVAFLVCTAMLLVQTQAQAASKITVIVASSVDTSEQNYMNVTYKKLVELAQKYSDNAFDFQLFDPSGYFVQSLGNRIYFYAQFCCRFVQQVYGFIG